MGHELKHRVLRNELAIIIGCNDGRSSVEKAEAVIWWIKQDRRATQPAPIPAQPGSDDALAMLRYVLPYINARAVDTELARAGPMEDAYINAIARRFIERVEAPAGNVLTDEAKDAARYRWLRARHVDAGFLERIDAKVWPPGSKLYQRVGGAGESLDRQVDAAIASHIKAGQAGIQP